MARMEGAGAARGLGVRLLRGEWSKQEASFVELYFDLVLVFALNRVVATSTSQLASSPSSEPFSSCVAVGFDVVQDEDGLHDRGRSAWAAAQLDQDFPGLEGGDRAFAAGADLRVRSVDGLLPA